MVSIEDYGNFETAWCPGCGNFGILRALKNALVDTGRSPGDVLLVSGIGQSGKLPHYLKCNFFNGLHGRTLPAATGARITNRELTIMAIAGDGDCYGEGGNHLIHAIRRNPDITLLVHDNQIYGLTKGQASPTTEPGMTTKINREGVFNSRLNPLALAISLDCSFVGRGFAGDIGHLSELIRKAIEHRGFSLVDILQPCVTFNRLNTFKWYSERVYKKEDDEYPLNDRAKAFSRSLEWGEKIPLGVFYVNERPVLEGNPDLMSLDPVTRNEAKKEIFNELIDKFM
ncbi:MAG: 2-oxoacid:ferredoxin oxidoreductase subunit beta [Methanosarcinaceae archaeon]|nr:2-oxoacid:ferredoxin oxidoreductase subunit beta [Methanosarcinaceae archaeon]